MRICLFLTFGGSLERWQEVGILARELALYGAHAAAGVPTTLVSYGGPSEREIAARFPFLTLLCNDRRLHPRLYALALPYLHGREIGRASIIKTNQLFGAHMAMRCARRYRKPLVIRQGYGLHSNSVGRHGAESLEARRALRYESRHLPRADALLYSTEDLARMAREKHGLGGMPIEVVPNYIVPQTWTPAHAPAGLPERPMRIAFLGRLVALKNLDALIRAAEGLPVELGFFGSGEAEEELKALGAKLSVACTFEGRRPQEALRPLLDRYHAFVLPSLFEGHPKALIEMMALGMPVLGTRVAGIAPEIEDGLTGLLCGSDVAGLRAGLMRLLGLGPEARTAMGAAARRTSLARYSLEAVARRERRFFEKLLSAGGRP